MSQAYVLAEDDWFSGTSNGNFKYNGPSEYEYITIPNVIKGQNVTSFDSMFSYDHGWYVKGVASYNPNVTSMSRMFIDSYGGDIDLTYLDTSGVTDMSSMFESALKEITGLSNFDTSNVTTMESMFERCGSKVLDLSNFDTSNVADFTSMFRYNWADTLDLSSFNTSNAVGMNRMFEDAEASIINIPNFDTRNVIGMSYMFKDTKTSVLDLSSFFTSSYPSMTDMFAGATATVGYAPTQEQADIFNNTSGLPSTLTFIVAEDFEPVYVMATDNDFSGTSNGFFKYIGPHQYVTIPHVIKGVSVTSYREMFKGTQATSLRGVKSTNTNVTNMRNMFEGNDSNSLDLSQLNTSGVTSMNYMFKDGQARSLDLTGFDTSNVTSMGGMFQDCQASVIDVSSFDTSKVFDFGSMFRGCPTTTLEISHFDTSSAIYMESMFLNCKVPSLDLSGFNTSNCTNMMNMFDGCEARTIDISSFDTSNVTDMAGMFRNCKATSLNLLGFDTGSVVYMSRMFEYSPLTILDLSSFDVSNVEFENMYNMFRGSSALHGFAGSTADAIKFNQTTNKPGRLNFIVRLGAADPFYWYKPDIDNELDIYSPYPYGWFSYGKHVANAPRYFGRHYFRIGDSVGDPKSTDYGIQLLGEIELPSPERDLEEVEVLGRDGTVLIDNKRFKPIRRELRFTVKVQEEDLTETGMKPFRSRTLHNRLREINSWILEKPGYQPWVFSMYPNYTYYARVVEPFLFHDVSKHYARGVINLEMMPYMDEMWYYSNLGSPAEPAHYTTEIEWEGDFPIKPIFELDLNGVTSYTAAKVINGAVLGGRLFGLKVRAGMMNNKVVIDCEKETVTYAGKPLDALLQVSNGMYPTFPTINPGEKFGILGSVEMAPGYSLATTNQYARVKWAIRRLAI